ncbi:MAG: Ig-like domain-containing protein [Rikenellaceae bacterium]|nr:Ig-like domain-containing protein [Rikenellaceae bacterium]
MRLAVLGLALAGVLWRCANPVTLQGGPRDSLPPRIVKMQPEWGTTNFTAKKVYIEFNEYVKLKDQQKEFFASPFMKNNPVVSLKGRGVEVVIKDTLPPNTTYALDFGGAIQDNNEGNPLNGFRFVFSTGPEIDSLLMSGYAVDGYTKDSVAGAFIFFYEAAKDTVPDTDGLDSLLFRRKPDAVARCTPNGLFIAQNLKGVDYRMYAVDDKNGNRQYDPGDDRVAFADSLCNPLTCGDFSIRFDTSRKYYVAEPQTYFRLFTDKKFKRQLLSKQQRPTQNRAELLFGAPYPEISSLTLDDIDSTHIIRDYSSMRDTLTLWLDAPPETLPDTVRGSITYLKHDSTNRLQPVTEKIALFWKAFEKKKKEKDEDDEKSLNPFKLTVDAASTLNPEKHIPITFEYPLRTIDSTAISLIRLADNKRYRVRHSVVRDTVNIRRWTIRAPWGVDQKYQLEIPAGAFENIRGERNDTLRSEFTVASPEKYGSISITVKGKNPESEYILQLTAQNGSLLQERRHAREGLHVFRYLDPGSLRIRVVEDVNANGRWDDGDLLRHLQPERVEIYFPEAGKDEIPVKANWEMEYTIDMAQLFAPVTIEAVREQLRAREQQRLVNIAKQREKGRQQRAPSGGGMMGGSGGMGGAGGGMPGIPGLGR